MVTQKLLDRYPITTDQVNKYELRIILDCLEHMVHSSATGTVVEFGCYTGTTSIFIQRLLRHYGPVDFHVYDSFQGLPDKGRHDQSPAGFQFEKGALKATRREFIQKFRRSGVPLPIIHSGWFNELDDKDVPQAIMFAFLDGDFYDSIRTSLKLIEPNLLPGAVVIVDDYRSEALPGAALAVDEWLRFQKGYALQITHSLAVITCGSIVAE